VQGVDTRRTDSEERGKEGDRGRHVWKLRAEKTRSSTAPSVYFSMQYETKSPAKKVGAETVVGKERGLHYREARLAGGWRGR
jgi:hypothetical protein